MQKFLVLLLLFNVAHAQSDRTMNFETWTSKKPNQTLTITPTGSGDVVIGSFSGVLKASSGTVSASNVDLTSEVTGTLPEANGGTGVTDMATILVELSGAQTISGSKTFDDALSMLGISTPSNPPAGDYKLYFKTDGNLYKLNSSGTEAQVGGGSGGSISTVTKTTSATLATSGEEVVLCDSTSGDVTLTLPAASGNPGLTYRINKIASANKCIIDGNASETVDGRTTYNIYKQYSSFQISTDGSNWYSLSGNPEVLNIDILHAADGSDSVGGSTSYKTRQIDSITGDSGFYTLDTINDDITLDEGKYRLTVNGGVNGDCDNVSFGWYNKTDASYVFDKHVSINSGAGDQSGFSVTINFEITSSKVYEFRTKASNAGCSNEYLFNSQIVKIR